MPGFLNVEMLANSQEETTSSGRLHTDVHLPATSRYELIEFIASEMPLWRDRADRPRGDGENVLTSQLCGHLNSAARHTPGWDFLQFRVEEPDEVRRGRKVDLVAAPCGATVWIEGRRHVDFDAILPIECKRLPVPNRTDRDEREYVYSGLSSTGGIQRFKLGHHGSLHLVGAMIAFVQSETANFWWKRVCEWIKDLVEAGEEGWTDSDHLTMLREDSSKNLTVLNSIHSRVDGAENIELRHLWLSMN